MASLYTLNGELLLEQHVCAEGDEAVTSCAFYEGSGSEYLDQNLIFTGHKRGAVNVSAAPTKFPPSPLHTTSILPTTALSLLSALPKLPLLMRAPQVWNLAIHDGKFVLEHVKRMNHLDSAGYNINTAITCILPTAQAVYTGDDDGRVVSRPPCFLLHLLFQVADEVSTNGTAYSGMTGDET